MIVSPVGTMESVLFGCASATLQSQHRSQVRAPADKCCAARREANLNPKNPSPLTQLEVLKITLKKRRNYPVDAAEVDGLTAVLRDLTRLEVLVVSADGQLADALGEPGVPYELCSAAEQMAHLRKLRLPGTLYREAAQVAVLHKDTRALLERLAGRLDVAFVGPLETVKRVAGQRRPWYDTPPEDVSFTVDDELESSFAADYIG